ncbi:hypothetical protein P0D69_21555 [Paraburkholderia sediminicola]|uniref:hypothetical protein n=1 Tax=Paraburkholderia sediminicola TaxID=458836 RepID=UPI0038BE114A
MNTFFARTREEDALPKISGVPFRVREKRSPTVPVLTFVKESVLASSDGYTVSTWVALSVPCSGIIMRSQIKIAPRTSGNVSEYALSRQAQALSLEQADRARAEKRRVNDALIDSNASKWRYSAPLAER